MIRMIQEHDQKKIAKELEALPVGYKVLAIYALGINHCIWVDDGKAPEKKKEAKPDEKVPKAEKDGGEPAPEKEPKKGKGE